MARAYYNEIDPYAAAWLRNLIDAGLIAGGDVDERSIVDVRPDDLAGYDQCHFFAGLGGWSRALRLAGWPDNEPVWTGSCPCQPFSGAGKRKGHADERHLWPAFHGIITECRPATVFGEQVASKDGREWFSAVRADLESDGYACGAADLCAAGIGAPHIRQRLWWVAQRLADADDARLEGRPGVPERSAELAARPGRVAGGLADADGRQFGGLAEFRGAERDGQNAGRPQGGGELEPCGEFDRPGPVNGFWADADWLHCRDGKWRPTQPEIFPLAHGIPARVGKLRAAGNAIVPQVGATFVRAVMAAQL